MAGPMVGGAMTANKASKFVLDRPVVVAQARPNGNGENSGIVVTPAFTPSANSTLLAIAYQANTAALGNKLSVADSNAGTWTQMGVQYQGPNSTPFITIELYTQAIGGTPASMIVTASYTAAGVSLNVFRCHVLELRGHTSDFSNITATGAAGTTPILILPSVPAANSIVMSYRARASTTPPAGSESNGTVTGHEIVAEILPTPNIEGVVHPYTLTMAMGNGAQTLTFSYVGSGATNLGVAWEIKST